MGKKEKSPNTLHMRLPKKEAVSDTESENSIEEETKIPILNIVTKIKTEPQSSSEDSDSRSDKVFTQKNPSKNTNSSSSSSDHEKFRKGIKKEVEQSSEEDSDSNKNVFQTNKYLISQSVGKKTIKKNVRSKEMLQDSDGCSSSSEQDVLRGAFLGKAKARSKKKSPISKLQSIQKVGVTRKSESLSSEESSDEVENIAYVNTTTPIKQKVKNTSKLVTPDSEMSLPRLVNAKNKISPQNEKQKKIHKSDSSVTQDASTDTISVNSNSISDLSNTSKVQVLQHIQFTPLKPMELLKKLYPDLTTVNINNEPNISDNKEIYFLKIPKNVNPLELLKKQVDLVFGSKVKLDNGEKYEFKLSNEENHPVLLVGNQSRVIQPKNTFILKEYTKPSKMPDAELIRKAMEQLPQNLKPCHPLFASTYEDNIELSESAELRLQKAIDDCLKENTEKKNKKRKRSNTIVENEVNEHEVIFSLLGNHTVENSIKNEEQSDSAFGSSESHLNSAKKKKAKRKSVEDNKSTMFEELEMSSASVNNTSIKKKTKRKSVEDNKSTLLAELDISSERYNSIQKKKTKRKSVEDTKPIMFTEVDISSSRNNSSKKKKTKREPVEGNNSTMFAELDVSSENQNISAKKKKAKRESVEDNKSTIFSEVGIPGKVEDEVSPKKKKHKSKKNLSYLFS